MLPEAAPTRSNVWSNVSPSEARASPTKNGASTTLPNAPKKYRLSRDNTGYPAEMTVPSESPPPSGHSPPSPLHEYLNSTYDLGETRIRVGYRGHGNSAWHLHSGAVRRLLGKLAIASPEDHSAFASHYIDYHYNTLLTPARQRGFHVDAGVELTDLQLLAKLQHFGAATGLLDFTLSPLVALWFACQEPDTDGTVFVLDISPSMNDTLTWENISGSSFSSVLDSLRSHSDLITWEPAAFGEASSRIIAQQSLLALMHPQGRSSRLVGSIPIRRDDKPDLLYELQALGVGEETLFLDVHGFSRANSPSTALREGSESATTLLNAANQQFQRANYPQAIATYTTLLQRYADAEKIHFLRGNAYASAGLNSEAIEDYGATLANREQLIGVSVAAVLFNKGNILSRESDYDAAISDYSDAIALRPSFHNAHFNRGNVYFEISELERAVDDYRNAGDSANAKYNQGNAHMILGQFEAALECYSLALGLGGSSEQLNNNLAHARHYATVLDGLDAHWDGEFQGDQTLRTARIRLPDNLDRSLFKRQPIISGNVGNIGNEGALNQVGGRRADGGFGVILQFYT